MLMIAKNVLLGQFLLYHPYLARRRLRSENNTEKAGGYEGIWRNLPEEKKPSASKSAYLHYSAAIFNLKAEAGC